MGVFSLGSVSWATSDKQWDYRWNPLFLEQIDNSVNTLPIGCFEEKGS